MSVPPRIPASEFADALSRARRKAPVACFAMYSSWFDGIAIDPALMVIPADDHIVHRGDGVFDALKCVNGHLYRMDAHLKRLASSAAAIRLSLPMPMNRVAQLLVETVRAGGATDCLARVFISRGPGSFTAKPWDCPAPHLYIVATSLPPPFMETHPSGAKLHLCGIPAKHPFFAVIKSCNYLQNALMEQEARDAGADFGVGVDSNGFLTEGATENIGVVTPDGRLAFPKLDSILMGTTMIRVGELAAELIRKGALKSVVFEDLHKDVLAEASEVLICGTTIDVAPVAEIDGRKVKDGRPGPVWRELYALLKDDIRNNDSLRIKVF